MFRSRLMPTAALAAGLLWAAGSAAQPPARPVAQPNPAPARPGLPLVPASAAAFVSLKVSDLVRHPDLKAAAGDLAKHPEALAPLVEAVGLSPLDVDRVTLFWPALGRDSMAPVMVVTTAEPFNEARLLRNLRAEPVFADAPRRRFGGGFGGPPVRAPEFKTAEPVFDPRDFKKVDEKFPDFPPPPKGAEGKGPRPGGPDEITEFEFKNQKSKRRPEPPGPDGADEVNCSAAAPVAEQPDPIFYGVNAGPFDALFLVDDRTLLFLPTRGYDAELVTFALLGAQLKRGTGPLAAALATADQHTFAAGVHLPPLFREFDRGVDRELVPYTALLAARTAVLTGDLGKTAKFALKLTFDDPAAARRAAPVLEDGIAAVAELVERRLVPDLRSDGPVERSFVPLVAAAAAGLRKAAVAADGATVSATAEADLAAPLAKVLAELTEAVRARAKAQARTTNLKVIGLALFNYEAVHGQFPANVYGPRGELLLSWRVQLLPYLEEDALFRQFKMDEPWDGPTNKKLVDKMPKVFQAPDREHKPGETFYQGFVRRNKVIPVSPRFGRPWLTEGDRNGVRIASIPDGTANTLAVVEAGDGVVWSKPDDLPFGGAAPKLGMKGWERTPALMFDGRTVLFPTFLRGPEFWPYVTVDGGEPVPEPERLLPSPPRPKVVPPPPGGLKKEFDPFPKGFEKGPPGGGAKQGEKDDDAALRRADERRAAAAVELAEVEVRVAAALVERLEAAVANRVARAEELDAARTQLKFFQARAAAARERRDALRGADAVPAREDR